MSERLIPDGFTAALFGRATEYVDEPDDTSAADNAAEDESGIDPTFGGPIPGDAAWDAAFTSTTTEP